MPKPTIKEKPNPNQEEKPAEPTPSEITRVLEARESREAPPAPPPPEAAPPVPEVVKPPEVEKPAPKKPEEGFLDETIEALKKRLKARKKKPAKIPRVRDELTVEIENIMEEDLRDAYQELTPIQQQEFKIKGEETALKIRDLLKSTKVKVKSIFKLILEWLKILPGINRFFLEQEAKIKTDKIIALKDRFK